MDKVTTFKEMFDFFEAGITDDMFLELDKDQTREMEQEILLAALVHFEFPRKDIFTVDIPTQRFSVELTVEEKMIIRQYMISEWLGFQLANVDLVRQRYSSADFAFTSQAAHMRQLIAMKKEYEGKGFHLQRLYNRRRRRNDGAFASSFANIMEPPKE